MSEAAAPFVATYKGRLASELTHAELLEAYTRVCEQLRIERDFQLRAWELERDLAVTTAILKARRSHADGLLSHG